MTEVKKIKLNHFHRAMTMFVEGYISAINQEDFKLDEVTIRNLPVLVPMTEEINGFRIEADSSGRVYVVTGSTKFARSSIRECCGSQKWSVDGRPGRHLRITKFRVALWDFCGYLEAWCFKKLPKDKCNTFNRTRVVTDRHEFARHAEEAFRRDHKLEIVAIPGEIRINGSYYTTNLTWKKLR